MIIEVSRGFNIGNIFFLRLITGTWTFITLFLYFFVFPSSKDKIETPECNINGLLESVDNHSLVCVTA